MRRFLLVGVLMLGTLAALNAAEEEKEGAKKEVTIVAVEGAPKKVTLNQGNVARITPKQPAGVTGTFKTAGPMKHLRTATIESIGSPIGTSGSEWEFETTGKGPASVTFTFKGGPLQQPKTVKYDFTVK